MKLIDYCEEFQRELIKGKSMEIQSRIIYPLIEISILKVKGEVVGATINPVALMIEENLKTNILWLME